MNSAMNTKNTLKAIIIILSVLLLAMAVVSVSFGVKYYKTNRENVKINEQLGNEQSKLSEQESVNASLKEENSSQAESFSKEYEKQSKEHQSEVDKLNNKIKDLNKQLSAKKEPVIPTPTPSTGKTVYLTFDDGPSSYTPQILDTLDKYGVKATFFVKNGGKYNYVMKDIVSRGHAIGLHTYTHDYAKIYASDTAYFNDLNKISDLVYEQTGVRSKIMRFPGGTSNTVSRKHSKGIMTRISKSVKQQGYVYFDWNCSNGDADGANTVQKQLNYCSQYPKSASRVVVLMHDTKKVTRDALPKIIEYYKSCGFEFGVLTTSVPPVQHRVNN